MRYSSRRRGFSLVELLIVIVVIGVLSSMMIFSSSESISSAKASNIISNLRSLKNAAFAMYINHPESFDTTAPSNPTKDQLALAMGESNIEGYDIKVNDSTKQWFIEATVEDNATLKNKLKARAKDAKLLSGTTLPTTTGEATTGYYDNGTSVYMFVR